jgi:hypothetical protein
MSFPCPNYKTDPAEFERMMREYERKCRIENAGAAAIATVFSLAIYGIYKALVML